MSGGPFKGLASFEDSERDAGLFFGREREREIIVANVQASRLTVLYGSTGVGKSSVLRAGVARDLRALPEQHAVVVFDDWRDDPVAALETRIAEVTGGEVQGSLAETLEIGAAVAGGEVVILLDGLEEEFLYHGSDAGQGSFLEEFSQAVTRPGLRASFLLAIREDALAKLDRFKSRIPNVFGNFLRLEHLDRTAGREAILGPIDRYSETSLNGTVEIEPALVEAVLDQVAAGRVELGGAGRGGVEDGGPDAGIEAPYLQLVMARLWEAESEAGSSVLRLETLGRLGGAEEIVRGHLEGALDSLDPAQRDLAAAAFNHLVTPSGTKIAHDASDLADYLGATPEDVTPVVESLARERILRPVPGMRALDPPRYEIYHDILADAVLGWRTRHESEREVEQVRESAAKRHRRLLAVAASAVLLAGAMAGLAIFAFTQQSEADAQRRLAQARALDGSALSQLGVDPELSLALAVEAARRDPGGQAETVLRRASLASRERAIYRTQGQQPVVAAEWALEGSRIFVAGGRWAVLYDARTRRPLLMVNNGAPITAAEISPNGQLIATGGNDGKVRLWEVGAPGLPRVLDFGTTVRSLHVNAAGSEVVAAGGQVVKVWHTAYGSLLFTHRFTWPVTGAILSPDGQRLAVMGNHPSAPMYSVADGKLLHRFVQGDFVKALAFSPDDRMLATGGRRGGALLWSVRTGKLEQTLPHGGNVFDLAFSPDGKILATACSDGVGRLWDVATGKLEVPLIGHTHFVVAIAFSGDGRYIVTSSSDGTGRVWDVGGEFRALLAGDTDTVTQASFSPDGRRVLTASKDGSARVWDPEVQPMLKPLATQTGAVAKAVYLPGGGILTAGPGPQALLLDANGKLVRRFRVGREVTSVAASNDGKIVAVGAGRRVTMFDAATGNRLRRLAQPGYVTAVAVSASGLVAAGGSDGVARIWGSGATPLHTLRGHTQEITGVAISTGGTRIATASADGTARIWDVASGRRLFVLARDTDGLTSVDFSPDGDELVTASKDADARLWSVASGKQEQLLRWHFGPVTDASFSPDGRWIVTAGPITLQLWQPGVREPLFRLGILWASGGMTSAVFAPDSRRLLAATGKGALLAYTCTSCGGLDELLPLAHQRLAATGRKLTQAEFKHYGG